MKKFLIGLGILIVIIILLMVTGVLKINLTAQYDGEEEATPTPEPSADVTSAGEVKLETYTSTAYGYSILKPVAWDVEEDTSSGGMEVIVSEPQKLAFVRIRAMSDSSINSPAAITTSIADYQASLKSQEGTTVTNFQTQAVGADGVGGFIAQGEFVISDVPFQFEERGLLATNGRVLILRAATVAQVSNIMLPVMQQMMESFQF